MNFLRLKRVKELANFFFRNRVYFLFLAIFVGSSTCFLHKASASSSEITDFQDQITDKRKEIAQAKRELKTINQELARLGDCQDLGDDPDYGGACDCTASSSCTDTDFKLAGVDRTQTDAQSCYTLYQAKKGLMAGFSYSCLSLIDRCGTVACLKRKKYDASLKAELDGADGTIKSDESDLKDLQSELEAAKKQCPNCGVASAQQQQRDPTTGELIIGGIQAVTPLIGMGLGTYANVQGMNRYYSSYNNGLQQCATIGVPCQAPAIYGLNNGLAYRTAGGLGSVGGVIGFGYGYGGGAAMVGANGIVGAGLGYGGYSYPAYYGNYPGLGYGGGGGAIVGVGAIVGGGLGYSGYSAGNSGFGTYVGYTVPYSGLGGGLIGLGGILGNTYNGYAPGAGYSGVGGLTGGWSGIGYSYPNSLQYSAGSNSLMIAQQQAYEAQARAYQMQSSASAYGNGSGYGYGYGGYSIGGGMIGGNFSYGIAGGILGNSSYNNNGYGTYSGYGSNNGSRSF